MAFINWSDTIGIIIGTATETTTGSLFLTLLMVLIFIMAVAMLFNIKLEYTAILILPLVLTYMTYYTEVVATGMILLIYLALILTKNFILR